MCRFEALVEFLVLLHVVKQMPVSVCIQRLHNYKQWHRARNLNGLLENLSANKIEVNLV